MALFLTQRYSASKTDQPGSIEQPVFTTQKISTRFQLVSGVSKLISVYAPYKDEKAPAVLRLVFVTIRPDR